MRHLCKYRFLQIIRNRFTLFWTLIFPIILMTFFSLVLSSAYEFQPYETLTIAMVDNDAYQQNVTLKDTLNQVENNGIKLFDVKETTKQNAQEMLVNKEVSAFVEVDDTIHVNINSSGMDETIIQTFFDTYLQQSDFITTLLEKGANPSEVNALFTETKSYIESEHEENSDFSSVSFYTCLAMSAINGAYLMLKAMYESQANQSGKAARVCIAPTHKLKTLLSNMFVTMLTQLVILLIQVFYLQMVLNVSFGDSLVPVLVLLSCAALAGNGIGVVVGSNFPKFRMDNKVSIVSGVSVFLSFLSGMMSLPIKWLVAQYAPFVALINPCNMITDGLYALYYFGIGERYYINLISLLIFSLLCFMIGYFSLRKKQYQWLEAR